MRIGVQNKKRCFPSADIGYFSKAKRRKNDALWFLMCTDMYEVQF